MLENTACGEHLAEVVGNRTVVTEAGKINVEVGFKFPGGDTGWKTLYSHTDGALRQLVKTLSVLGFKLKSDKHPDGKYLEELGDDSLAGKKALVTVEENEYQGRVRKQISWVNIAKEKPKADHFKTFNAALGKLKTDEKEDEFA